MSSSYNICRREGLGDNSRNVDNLSSDNILDIYNRCVNDGGSRDILLSGSCHVRSDDRS